MKIFAKTLVVILLSSKASLAFAQAKPATSQQAGDCSVNITGSGNTASLSCTNIDPKLAEQVRSILNGTQRNEKATKEISEKLDVVLKEIRKQRPTPRRIPPDRQAEIVAILARNPAKISISAIQGSEEAYDFAQDWFNAFKAAGWDMMGRAAVGIFMPAGRTGRGISLGMHGDPIPAGASFSPPAGTPAGAVGQAFERLKLNDHVYGAASRNRPADDFWLLILAHPDS
jgi:hypothetical protein